MIVCDRCGAKPDPLTMPPTVVRHVELSFPRSFNDPDSGPTLMPDLCGPCFVAIQNALHQKASEMLLERPAKGEST